MSSGPSSLYLVEVRHWWAKKEAPERVQMRGGKTLVEQGTRGAFIEALPLMERVYVVLGRAAGSIYADALVWMHSVDQMAPLVWVQYVCSVDAEWTL